MDRMEKDHLMTLVERHPLTEVVVEAETNRLAMNPERSPLIEGAEEEVQGDILDQKVIQVHQGLVEVGVVVATAEKVKKTKKLP